MTRRLTDLEARIGTVHKLATVISAMRGIAASHAQEAQRHVTTIRKYAQTIGEAIGQALMLLPEPDFAPSTDRDPGRLAIILIAAEQGFAGAYTERIFDAADGLARTPHDLFVVGERGLLVADERGLKVRWSAAMITHAARTTVLATHLAEAIDETLADRQISRVSVIHAVPGAAEGPKLITKQLLPFDYSRFPVPAQARTPRITLPPQTLLARLVEEYVFSELSEAVMLAFSAENEARMRAMIAAHDNVSENLDNLVAASRRLRQDEITEEIVELATGNLSIG